MCHFTVPIPDFRYPLNTSTPFDFKIRTSRRSFVLSVDVHILRPIYPQGPFMTSIYSVKTVVIRNVSDFDDIRSRIVPMKGDIFSSLLLLAASSIPTRPSSVSTPFNQGLPSVFLIYSPTGVPSECLFLSSTNIFTCRRMSIRSLPNVRSFRAHFL